MAKALLTLRDILVRYGPSTILEFSSLSVHAGEILAVIGPNGAGKSTLLRLMGLLQQPTQGKIYFHDREVIPTDGLAIRRRMASVFQEPLLLNASLYNNAALGLKLRGMNRHMIDQRLRPWLKRLGIEHLASRKAHTLSGGEAQRASLARALALDPEILLLDEPFAPLDPPTREVLLLDLDHILHETSITTVFVTHDRDEAFMFGDRIAVLIGGKLLQTGPTTEVFAHPENLEVAQFVGMGSKIAGVVESASEGLAQVRINGGRVQVIGNFTAGAHVFLCLRPEDITLSLPGAEDPKYISRNQLQSTALKVTPWGPHYRVALACGENRLVASIARPSLLELNIAAGDEVVVSFKPSAVHVIRQN